MRGDPARPITLRDGMIIVAAAALSFWFYRICFRTNFDLGFRPISYYKSIYWRSARPVLIVPSLAILALRLLGPRVRGMRLRRQPGYIASLVVILAIFLHLSFYSSVLPGMMDIRWDLASRKFLLQTCEPSAIAPAIAIAWFVQWVLGAWRPERSWIDRLGRGIGWAWIACYLVDLADRHFHWYR